MSKQAEFEFESLVDKDTIVQYLETITKGFKTGHISLATKGETILLDPNGLMKLEIEAKNKQSRSKILIKVSWKDTGRVSIQQELLSPQ